jgi:DNA-directed RNA polymerase specialized sigma24 family protein
MAGHGSVTGWLLLLKDGNRHEAVSRLWAAYFERMVELARDRLRVRPRSSADEEDVALSAFDSFVRATQAGRFPRLDDRDDLWQVLFVLTTRKTIDLIEKDMAQKAGAGRVVSLSTLWTGEEGSSAEIAVPAAEPDPAEVVAMTEGLERMLDILDDAELKQMVIWRMSGDSNREIAERLDRSLATVERKFKTIRSIYREGGLWGDAESWAGS